MTDASSEEVPLALSRGLARISWSLRCIHGDDRWPERSQEANDLCHLCLRLRSNCHLSAPENGNVEALPLAAYVDTGPALRIHFSVLKDHQTFSSRALIGYGGPASPEARA